MIIMFLMEKRREILTVGIRLRGLLLVSKLKGYITIPINKIREFGLSLN